MIRKDYGMNELTKEEVEELDKTGECPLCGNDYDESESYFSEPEYDPLTVNKVIAFIKCSECHEAIHLEFEVSGAFWFPTGVEE